ncbi:GspH/FimT family pseudopilin, partial [Desulfobacterales bacterium HSG16]|nr:GspH/FimT family pseudopilin [Desulfobacterales bacterium HSG16]
ERIYKMKKNSGFSLVELLTVMGVMAIMAAIAVPAWVTWLPTARLKSAARELHSMMQISRLAAVKYNTSVVIRFEHAGHDAIAFEDNGAGVAAGNENFDDGERIIKMFDLPADIIVENNTNSSKTISYNSRGMAPSGGGTVTIKNTKDEKREVIVSKSGHPRIKDPANP